MANSFFSPFIRSIDFENSLFVSTKIGFVFVFDRQLMFCALAPRSALGMKSMNEWKHRSRYYIFVIFVSPKRFENQINCVEMQFITNAICAVCGASNEFFGWLDVLGDVPSHSVSCSTRRSSKHVMKCESYPFHPYHGCNESKAKAKNVI